MTHIAIQEKLDGKPVDWLEHVTAEQYEGRSDASQCVRPFHITSPVPRASPLDGAPVAEEPSRWAVVPYWRLSPGVLDCGSSGEPIVSWPVTASTASGKWFRRVSKTDARRLVTTCQNE